ncbi:MAG: Wzz/FepE/Etk N-terminal domain-containing protein [Bacteroidia bacterium]
MDTENTPKNDVSFDASFLVSILVKHRKQLIAITLTTVALSILFSSPIFITPKYKSTAIIYPFNIIPYSSESPTEQLIQLLESEDIRDAVANDFNFIAHYEIDSTGRYPLTELHETMKENINIDKTKFESVEIIVMDKDPKMASDIADSIVSKLNKKSLDLLRKKSLEVVIISENQLKLRQAEIDSMQNLMKQISKEYGIVDMEQQIRSLSRVYYEGVSKGAGDGKRLENVIQAMGAKGFELVGLAENVEEVRKQYNKIKQQYDQSLRDMTKELTYSNIITSPVPAEKKSYPVRSMIVLLSTISTLVLSITLLIIFEGRKQRS